MGDGLVIYLCSVGEPMAAEISLLQRELAEIFGARAAAARPSQYTLPKEALSERRGQYHSTVILRALARNCPRDQRPLLGVTNVDIYVEGLNFVFGEADPRNQVAIISTHRLAWAYTGGEVPRQIYEDRIVKEAVHELGHVLGLGHCPNPRCVMFFSNSILDTDRKGKEFCPRCRSKLSRR